MSQLTKLFEPGSIGSVELKNRIVMAPMGRHSCDADGVITDKALSYYYARARGGVGLVIIQATTVTADGGSPKGMRLYDDRFVPSMKELARIIHQGGAKAFVQLNHLGKMMSEIRKGFPHPEEINVIGPSAIPWAANNVVPREMSKQDINSFVGAFGEACRRAKEAGFDGVEVHAAHGYLMHSFLSPFTNRRNDEYGGSTGKRARLVCEVLEGARKKVGPDFALTVRVSGTELMAGGIQIGDVVAQAPLFVESGADAMHISGCGEDYAVWIVPSYLEPEGVMVHLAEKVKKAVKVPVIAVGRLGDPILAERVLQEGKADFIALGRPLLADPDLPNKARQGRLQEINRCISCNNCFMIMFAGGWKGISDLTCTVNPGLLAEADSVPEQTSSPRKVMVIGGGLAGMQAARDLARRGHNVSLYEKTDRLGGQWNIVCREDGKADFARYAEYLERGLKKAGVKVLLNRDVTPAFVTQAKPDVVVVATGACPAKPSVPGEDGKNVVQAVDVIAGKATVGEKVVVIGGRYVGMEMALSLARKGKDVILATRSELGRNVEKCIYLHLRDELIEKGVRILVNSPVYEITGSGVYVAHQSRLLFLKADTVVLAVGFQPRNRLAEELKGIVPEVHLIGDCVEPRTAVHATQEAASLALRI